MPGYLFRYGPDSKGFPLCHPFCRMRSDLGTGRFPARSIFWPVHGSFRFYVYLHSCRHHNHHVYPYLYTWENAIPPDAFYLRRRLPDFFSGRYQRTRSYYDHRFWTCSLCNLHFYAGIRHKEMAKRMIDRTAFRCLY